MENLIEKTDTILDDEEIIAQERAATCCNLGIHEGCTYILPKRSVYDCSKCPFYLDIRTKQ
jgi:hypothetical protein